MKKPLVFFTIFFIFGIVWARFVSVPAWGLLISLFIAVIVAYFFLKDAKLFFLSALACFFLMGAFLFCLSLILPQDHIKNYTPSSGVNAVLTATVISEPVYKKNKSVFVVKAQYLKLFDSILKVRGKVIVWCFKDDQINMHGQITAQGKLYKPYSFKAKGKLNYRDYLRQRDIYSQLSISGDSFLRQEKINKANFMTKGLSSIRTKTRYIIDNNLSFSAAGLISAMILGDRSRVPDIYNESLKRSGTVHVLAVSGLHTGIIIIIALLFFSFFPLHYRIKYLLVMLVLVFYCWFTGWRVSVSRATIMGSVFLLAEIINRDYDSLSALSLGALIILWLNPAQLFNVGFQLSFCSVFSILIISPRIFDCFSFDYKKVKILRFLMQGVSVSLGAWIGTLGIVAYYFNIFTPISVLANLLIIPILFLIILSAILFIVLAGIFPVSAPLLALNCEFFTVFLYKVNSLIISIPQAYILLPNISLKYIFVYYGILIIICFYILHKTSVENLESIV